MFYRLYGITAPNIILSGMPPRLFRGCLDGYAKDPLILTIVKRQFEEMEKVLSSIPSGYIDPLDRRTYARLRRLEMENPNDPQIEVYKKELEGKPMDIADFVMIDGKRYPISDVSKSIIIELKKSLRTIKNYKNYISINYKTEKEELFFGYPLYQLRTFSMEHLMYFLNRYMRNYMDRNKLRPEFWTGISTIVDSILAYTNDKDENIYNMSNLVLEDVREFTKGYDYNALNGLLGLNATEEDYHKASLELHDIGLVGFTPFTEEMFKEFLNNYNPSYSSDLFIKSDSNLFKFISYLKRACDSNLEMGASLIEKSSVESNDVNNDDEEIVIEI